MVAALCVLAAAPAAHAAFPGKNGKIAYSSGLAANEEIYTMNDDGTNQANITNSVASDVQPAWSPDGTKIAFSARRDDNEEIYAMNADGTNQTRLTNNVAPDRDPAWSPDGTKIAFERDIGSQASPSPEIHTMNADGTNQTRLTFGVGENYDPAWSPDGTKIAFSSSRDGNFEIYTMNADGTNQTNITNIANYEVQPTWSPDGTKIAFTRSHAGGNYEIYTMNADGTNQTNITNNTVFDDGPAWSPDGTKIAFRSLRDGNQEIYTMNADGSAATRRTIDPAPDVSHQTFQPDWQPIPINAYPRPAGATPLHVSLVTAYEECTAPNRTHGPPLDSASCNPPTRSSAHLTVGTADSNGQVVRNKGYLRLRTILGNPSTSTDEADVGIDFFSQGALTNTLADYTGELRAEVPLRITDKDNTPHPGGPGAATTQDFTFDVDATCVVVPEPSPHSACQTTTTADALIPGAIKEGRRSIWQLGQVIVYDGGADGDTATAGNTVFARQGVFIP